MTKVRYRLEWNRLWQRTAGCIRNGSGYTIAFFTRKSRKVATRYVRNTIPIRIYFPLLVNLSGLTYTTGAMGSDTANFYQTQYGYNDDGLLDSTETPNGTIYISVYDSYGDVLSDWVGTNDTPSSGEWSPSNNTGSSNMVEVDSYQYDNGGVGDGNLTQETDYPQDGASNSVTDYFYDWRDRLVAEQTGVGSSSTTNAPIIYTTYDNLNEATETQVYDGAGVTVSFSGGVPNAPSSSLCAPRRSTATITKGSCIRRRYTT